VEKYVTKNQIIERLKNDNEKLQLDIDRLKNEEYRLIYLEKIDELIKENLNLTKENKTQKALINSKELQIEELKRYSNKDDYYQKNQKIEELETKILSLQFDIKNKDEQIEKLRAKKIQVVDKNLQKENLNFKLENTKLKTNIKELKDEQKQYKIDNEKIKNKLNATVDDLREENRKIIVQYDMKNSELEMLRKTKINEQFNEDNNIDFILRNIHFSKNGGYIIKEKIWKFPDLKFNGILLDKLLLESMKEKNRIKQKTKIRELLGVYFILESNSRIQLTDFKIMINYFLAASGIVPLNERGTNHDLLVEELRGIYTITKSSGSYIINNIKFNGEYKII
jgi:hypothetical protein